MYSSTPLVLLVLYSPISLARLVNIKLCKGVSYITCCVLLHYYWSWEMAKQTTPRHNSSQYFRFRKQVGFRIRITFHCRICWGSSRKSWTRLPDNRQYASLKVFGSVYPYILWLWMWRAYRKVQISMMITNLCRKFWNVYSCAQVSCLVLLVNRLVFAGTCAQTWCMSFCSLSCYW